MKQALTRIATRMAVFAVVGIVGTLVVNGGDLKIGQVAITLMAFLVMNIGVEVFRYNKYGKY